ncbi:MAG: amidase [Acidimicrobiales bacterium]
MSDSTDEHLAFMSTVDLARALRDRVVSSREVLDAVIARIERLDGPVNSVVTTDYGRARTQAAAADEATARGESRGPLHGVPMTIKDSWQTAGLLTTSGAPELADHVPDEDAWPVARLKQAGAIVFAKTNLPIYAGDFQSYNDLFGTTNNPFDSTRTPGGSSGGAAAALACGFTPLELGSDIGGSIRLPSHMSGVAGHKPSYAIVPAHGQIPGPPGTLTQADLAVAGPMARTVEDLELALGLMAGPDRWNQPAWRLELPPPRRARVEDYRIGAWLDDPRCPVEPEVRGLLETAAAALAGAGAVVDDSVRPGFSLDKAMEAFLTLLQSALSGGSSPEAIEGMAASADDTPGGAVKRRISIRHREWLSVNERRLQMRMRWEELFTSWDAMLLPVMPCTALPHDHSEPMRNRTVSFSGKDWQYWDAATWMAPAGACYLPATVVPVGLTSGGLPVGIQIVGPYLGDRTTLDVARHVLAAAGGCSRPPGF